MTNKNTAFMKRYGVSFMMLVLVLGFSGISFAQPIIVLGDKKATSYEMTVGKSVIFKSSQAIESASIAAPEVAECLSLSSTEVYVAAKAPGSTRLMITLAGKVTFIKDLMVSYDINGLKQKLNEMMPDEKNIQVTATNKTITLCGRVSSAVKLSQALAIAKGFVPKESEINNLLELANVNQVMLEVRVAEMSTSVEKRLGINLGYARGSDFALSTLGSLSGIESITSTGGLSEIITSSNINTLLRFGSGTATWTALIDILKENELVKILAEPTIVATSGQEASFLAGGEIPIPIPGDLGDVEIEFKPYGVGLTFTPTVLSGERISLRVAPEVSEPDYTRLVYYSGYAIPAFTTRRTSTTIELGDGQSFAIAGLLKDEVRQIAAKYPVLGEIPVLGALFKSSEFQKNKSELVIVVTPHLVKPLDMTKQTLPTDYYIEPDDFEFYLLGAMEGREKPVRIPETFSPQEGMEGAFGHIEPGFTPRMQ
jgi:pilus assembly protein CpaC